MNRKTLLVLLGCFACSTVLLAQNSVIAFSAFSSAGGHSINGNSLVAASAGESFVGFAEANNVKTIAGFLSPAGVSSGVTSVEDQSTLPSSFALYQNYPNPFNPVTTIAYDLPSVSEVTLKVFNLLGQEVATLVHGEQSAGRYKSIWDGRNSNGVSVSTGIYFYHFQAKELTGEKRRMVQTKKLVLVK